MTLNAKVQKQIKQYGDFVCASDKIDGELYSKYEVKRGLRDISGKGVLAGLTEISAITGYVMENEDLVPCEGSLFYRGYNIKDLVAGFTREKRFGFEEICYLLLFGHLPSAAQYGEFKDILNACMELPEDFVRGTILKTPGCDMMNSLAYGMGHAVYSLSNLCTLILKSRVEQLAHEKDRKRNSNFTYRSNGLLRKSSPKNVKCTKAYVQISTFIRVFCTGC